MADEKRRAAARATRLDSGVRRRHSSATMSRVRPATILIVDDDESLRACMERMVCAGGWDAISTDDPQLAFAQCVKEPPDLVITDYDMPSLKGTKLASLIRYALGDAAPPVILVTANAPAMVAPQATDVAKILSKPIEQARLHEAILNALPKPMDS